MYSCVLALLGARAPLTAKSIARLARLLSAVKHSFVEKTSSVNNAHATLNKATDASNRLKAHSELVAAKAAQAQAKARLKAYKQRLAAATQLSVARAYAEIFSKAHALMTFDSTSTFFHTLDAPKGAFFPFSGTGPNDAFIERLLLRKSHNGLYKGLVTHLSTRKVDRSVPGTTFIVRGPPGTGKSAMLNLLWYIARFKLNMNVICHFPNNDIHHYAASTDDSDSFLPDSVEALDRDEVKLKLAHENTLYLFDSSCDNGLPVHGATAAATTVISTPPYLERYSNICKSATDSAVANFVPLWSYAWKTEEIEEAFELTKTFYSPKVDDAVEHAKGDFKFALEAACGDQSEATVRTRLKDAITAIDALALSKLSSVSSVNNIIHVLYDNKTVSTSAFKLSHAIWTIEPSSSEPPIAWSPQVWLSNCKHDVCVRATNSMDDSPAYQRHLNCDLEWASPEAPYWLLDQVAYHGTTGMLRSMYSLVRGGKDVEGQDELPLLFRKHHKPYDLVTESGTLYS